MKTIYKYTLGMYSRETIGMPAGAEIIAIKLHYFSYELWAIVEPDQPMENRTIIIVGTGRELPDEPLKHIDTVIDGSYVWHFFVLQQ
ncbi:MAG TPA: hypothetical protein VGF75_00420 [Candidatus Saccharimonadales bacterium]|jgi:hypothetical protein